MRPRGAGSVYLRGAVYWVKYYDRDGKPRRESSESSLKSDADRLLRKRVGEIASGKRFIGPALERTTFEDLASLIQNDYRANQRRCSYRLGVALNHLASFFGRRRASDIGFGALQAYRVLRLKTAAPATVRLGARRFASRLPTCRAGRHRRVSAISQHSSQQRAQGLLRTRSVASHTGASSPGVSGRGRFRILDRLADHGSSHHAMGSG